MTDAFSLRESDQALVDRVASGKLGDIDAGEVQRLADLRRLGVLSVVRGSGDDPDVWSVTEAYKPKRKSAKK